MVADVLRVISKALDLDMMQWSFSKKCPYHEFILFFFNSRAMLDSFWRLLISNIRVITSKDLYGSCLLPALLLSYLSDLHAKHSVKIASAGEVVGIVIKCRTE